MFQQGNEFMDSTELPRLDDPESESENDVASLTVNRINDVEPVESMPSNGECT